MCKAESSGFAAKVVLDEKVIRLMQKSIAAPVMEARITQHVCVERDLLAI